MLQRTLLLAQRAADDAVNEAQARAKQMLEESETKAQALVSDAEATARRIAEGERRRLEAELLDLSARREQLRSDADALEAYVANYRDRIRAAIEDDLTKLSGDTVEPPSERPEIHEVEIPVDRDPAPTAAVAAVVDVEPEPEVDLTEHSGPTSRTGSAASAAPAGDDWDGPATRAIGGLDASAGAGDASPYATESSAGRSPVAAPPRPEPSEWPPTPVAEAAPGPTAAPAPESSWLSAADSDWGTTAGTSAWDAPAPWEREALTTGPQPLPAGTFDPEPMEANTIDTDSLDDDAFFASLREAVRDDAPLGPRDEEQATFFDGDSDQDRRRFRRRR